MKQVERGRRVMNYDGGLERDTGKEGEEEEEAGERG